LQAIFVSSPPPLQILDPLCMFVRAKWEEWVSIASIFWNANDLLTL
jgi:hypothetical protein